MPKRPASHGQSRRKRGRRRYVVPTAPPGPARPRPDAPNVVPFPAHSHPGSEARSAPLWMPPHEYRFVNRELVRIAVISTAILVLLAVLTFVL